MTFRRSTPIRRAITVLNLYEQLSGETDEETLISDLLADLYHYTHASRMDWDLLANRGVWHASEEIKGK